MRALVVTSEDALQRAAVSQWHVRGVPGSVLAAIPNGEHRSKVTAARLKALGVLPGFPDLFAAGAGGMGLIELKRPCAKPRDPNKDLSGEQRGVIGDLRALNLDIVLFVSNDLDEVLAILETLGVLRPSR